MLNKYEIANANMILAYEKEGDEEGTLVFIGNKQNREYDSWFMQEKPITPIHHTSMDLEENVVYDEYGTLPVTNRTGYTFDGWYTEATGGTKITSSSSVGNK